MTNREYCLWNLVWFLFVSAHAFQGFDLKVSSTSFISPLCQKKNVVIDTALWSTPKRKPRRDLQKRRRKNKDSASSDTVSDQEYISWRNMEIRPLIKSKAKEMGVDYWIDEAELEKYNEAQLRKPREAGQVPDEKLWKEVLSPYKQNWIGYFSVLIVIISAIIINFPELLLLPVISIPDL